ncbi:MAG: xanthine dehydrogenase family protein molybdopterin-binding subunit [Desulfobacterales bacterium]|nr:xanthine dehydrogenase family protein molybdopterin-binding subunit [Desulfobacterales bacterium]
MKDPSKAVGQNIHRFDARGKLTGETLFCADLPAENYLCLKVLRSSRHHAVIRDIHTSAALEIPGVKGVFTARDIPGKNLMGIINKDQPLLAEDKVRSMADAVALVAADTEAAATAAIAAVKVDYEALPALLTPEEALAQGAENIHEKGNTLCRRKVKKGDADSAFKTCASVIENTYTTPAIEHNYLEPDAGAGYVDGDGCLTIYASTQNPHYDHKEVAGLLDLPDEKVRIIMAATGGGFGSKLDLNVQGFIGLALYHLKMPVRYVYSREEAYLASSKRHPFSIKIKTGTDRAGCLKAVKIRAVCNTGAYGSYGMAVASRAAVVGMGPYAVETADIECLAVYTNTTFCGAMRGFGAPQMALAHESQMDLHALDLGMDPWQIRHLNGFRAGSETATCQELKSSVGFLKCLEAIRPYYDDALSGWATASPSPFIRRGVGLGAMWYGIGNTGVQNPSTARIEMDKDGRVSLFTGCADIGQGSTTVLAQIAAQVLGIPPGEIKMVVADTRHTTSAGATSASRQTYISGNAVKDAAEKLKKVLLTEAVNTLKQARIFLRLENGAVIDADHPEKKTGLSALARRIHDKGGSLSWQGYFDPDTIPQDPETGEGVPYATYAFACQAACVEVDVLTGQVDVKKVIAAHDVGKAIHPEQVKGQICGGVAMGVGFATMEEFVHGSTASMKDYHVPTISDMPEVVPIIVEDPEPSGPFGAKGVGEPALIPTAPAIVNGIAQALGSRIYSLPASLEKVLDASIRAGHFTIKEED